MSKKSDESLNKKQDVDQGRRNVAKAGLAAPVIMTLSSKSAFGMGRECTPSNLASGNLSSPVDMSTCGGCTPGYWGSAPHADYEGAGVSAGGADPFVAVFGYMASSCSDTGGGIASNCLGVTPFLVTDRLIDVVSNPPVSTINTSNGVLDDMIDNHGNYQNWQGMLTELGRQAVAAFLNASHPNVAYSLTPAAVIADFKMTVDAFIGAYDGTKTSINKKILEAQKDIFDGFNNLGICPLGNDPKKP